MKLSEEHKIISEKEAILSHLPDIEKYNEGDCYSVVHQTKLGDRDVNKIITYISPNGAFSYIGSATDTYKVRDMKCIYFCFRKERIVNPSVNDGFVSFNVQFEWKLIDCHEKINTHHLD